MGRDRYPGGPYRGLTYEVVRLLQAEELVARLTEELAAARDEEAAARVAWQRPS